MIENDIHPGGSESLYIKDSYLALVNGWQKLADGGHIVDAAGANIGLSVFGKMLRAMPTKFRRNKKDLRFFVSPDLWQIYLEKVASRGTALGDAAAGGEDSHTPFGVKVVPIPLWDFLPPVVEHIVLTGTTPTALLHKDVSSVVVTPSTLGATPSAAYILTTDYVVDAALGTITRDAGGAISSGATVKVTYASAPQIMLTHMDNFIVGIGRDIRFEKDRDIFKGVNQYAVTVKADVQFEEVDALVKAKNIGQQ